MSCRAGARRARGDLSGSHSPRESHGALHQRPDERQSPAAGGPDNGPAALARDVAGIAVVAYWFALLSVLRGRCNSEPAVTVRDPADALRRPEPRKFGSDGVNPDRGQRARRPVPP